jgi:hypothetical protein
MYCWWSALKWTGFRTQGSSYTKHECWILEHGSCVHDQKEAVEQNNHVITKSKAEQGDDYSKGAGTAHKLGPFLVTSQRAVCYKNRSRLLFPIVKMSKNSFFFSHDSGAPESESKRDWRSWELCRRGGEVGCSGGKVSADTGARVLIKRSPDRGAMCLLSRVLDLTAPGFTPVK